MTLKSRRNFLKTMGVGSAMLAFPILARSAIKTEPLVRHLAFDNLHTGEKLAVTYFENGRYIPEALSEVNYLLRDYRTGDKHPMDTGLLDLLHDVQARLDVNKPFQVISGYRSPKTNAMLHKNTRGVAKKSLHMQGKAIDICLEGVDLKAIRDMALLLGRGGVGYYPTGFVHLDTGKVRSW